MSIIQSSTTCVFCSGVVLVLHDIKSKDIDTTCSHCGYELCVKENSNRPVPVSFKQEGFGTYHIQYKNGYKTFGCYHSRMTGKDVQSFINFIECEPSINEDSCSLIRFDHGQLYQVYGQMPPLSEDALYGGRQYA